MKFLINEQQKSYQKSKICSIWKERFADKNATDKKCRKVSNHCHNARKYGGSAHSICNLKYSDPKEISIVFFTMDLTMIIVLS